MLSVGVTCNLVDISSCQRGGDVNVSLNNVPSFTILADMVLLNTLNLCSYQYKWMCMSTRAQC